MKPILVYILFYFFIGTSISSANLLPPNYWTGPSSSTTGVTDTYTFSNGNVYMGVTWYVSKGSVVSSSQSGTTYSVQIQWQQSGTGSIQICYDTDIIILGGTKSVGITGTPYIPPPPTPETTFSASSVCGSTVVTRNSSPLASSGITWYWQTSEGGTSTANNGPTYTLSSTGMVFLRARQIDSPYKWSTATLSSATITVYTTPSTPATATDGHIISNSLTAVPISVSPVAGAAAYKWYYTLTGGTSISNSPTTNTYSPMINSTKEFYVETINGPCVSPSRRLVTAYKHPEPMITTEDGSVNMGAQAVLKVMNYGYDSYQWVNAATNTDISGATSSTFTTGTAGEYKVRVTKSSSPAVTTAAFSVGAGIEGLNMNYIVSNTILVEGVTNESEVADLLISQKSQSIQYFDGLGAPLQSVITQGSPLMKDIVQQSVYDGFGREHRKYLPVVVNKNSGWFKPGIINEQGAYSSIAADFYVNNANGKIAQDEKPYSETVFEASPANRPLKEFGVGEVWSSGNKYISYEYRFNTHSIVSNDTAEKVISWKVVSDKPMRQVAVPGFIATNGYFESNQLSIKITKDEHGNAVREYSNKQGQMLLKKVQAIAASTNLNSENDWALTYYVYDDFGNLRFVLPPELSKIAHSSDTAAMNATRLNNWAFQYKYDAQKRMTHKQVPGASVVYMVYDNRDRLVMTQDGNQRSQNKWLYTKYDQLNRPILTGIYAHGSLKSQAGMDSLISTTKFFEMYNGVSATHGYTNTVFPVSGTTVLTATYYDNYNFKSMVSGLNYVNNDLTGQLTTEFTRLQGQVTGTKVNILGSSSYMYSVTYFDDKYRPIQTISQNHKSGSDRATSKFDFVGKVLETKRTYLVSGVTRTVKETFSYDHAGRLLTVNHSTNGATNVMIVKNEYNELGQIVDKKLHSADSGATFKQSVDYRYNIHGWLTSMNNSKLNNTDYNDDINDLFGMELGYESDLGLGTTPQYNGNIAAMKWSNNTIESNVLQRGYAFSYDELNRLKAANQKQTIVYDTWTGGNYDENVLEYDLNGNIKVLQRKDGAGETIDSLTYDYGTGVNASNKLQYVSDAADATKGFINGNTGVDDYTYDVNGNLITDKNKAITAITYNHLNLPVQVNKGVTDYIIYTYDASGRKIAQQVLGSTAKTTDYVGELIFENNALKFINQSEGRILPDGTNWEYQYHLKDHLGNVRATFSAKEIMDAKTATLESANATAEKAEFLEYAKAKKIQSHLFDHTNGVAPSSTPGYSQRLTGSTYEKYGLAKSISVMPGDVVSAEVFAKYVDQTPSNWTTALNTLIGQIAANASGVVSLGENYGTSNNAVTNIPTSYSNVQANDPEAGPKAYLNWLVFKRDGTFMSNQSGYDRLSEEHKEYGQDVAHDSLYSPNIMITEPGFVYIYLSNEEGTPLEVYFDDFKVTHTIKTPVVQTDDYYPFGGEFNSYTRESSVKNQYKFNGGSELQDELDLNVYWTDLRTYDPWGRCGWWQIDPKVDDYYNLSPYNFSFNNPVRYNDPRGDCPPDDPNCGGSSSSSSGPSIGTLFTKAVDAAVTIIDNIIGGGDESAASASQFNDANNTMRAVGVETATMKSNIEGYMAPLPGMSSAFNVMDAGQSKTTGEAIQNLGKAAVNANGIPVFGMNPGAPSLKQQGANLAKVNNGNRVTLRSQKIKVEADLAGDAHFSKTTQQYVQTPHVKISGRNSQAPNQPAYNTKNVEPRSMTQKEIRVIRKYIESLQKK